MSLTVTPPIRPRASVKVRRGPKFYWTIHTHPNHAFSVRVNENSQTALVGFKSIDDALMIGQMIEKHYIEQKAWPETDGQIVLPSASIDSPLQFLFCRKWDFEDLKVACTKNFLNMVTVDEIVNSRGGFSFNGKVLSFEAPTEFYVARLQEILELE